MADRVEVEVVANTKKGISSMAKYATAVAGAAVVVAGLVKLGGEMLQAYGEQEKAERKLDAALMATGRTAETNTAALKRLASELQNVTEYGDETTIAAMAMMQQLGDLGQEGLEMVTPLVQDFAAAMDLDLNTAAALVGKTLGSSTNALARYGVEIDAAAPKTEKLAQLTEALDSKFGGMAQTMADTTLGKMTQLKNAWGDLKETGGELIARAIIPMVSWFGKAATAINNLFNETEALKPQHLIDLEEVQNSLNEVNASYQAGMSELSETAKEVIAAFNALSRIEQLAAVKSGEAATERQRKMDLMNAAAASLTASFEALDTTSQAAFGIAGKELDVMPDKVQLLLASVEAFAKAAGTSFDVGNPDSWVYALAVKFPEVMAAMRAEVVETYAVIETSPDLDWLTEYSDKIKGVTTDLDTLYADMETTGVASFKEMSFAMGMMVTDYEAGLEAAGAALKDFVSSGIQALGDYLAKQALVAIGAVLMGDFTKIPAAAFLTAAAGVSYAAAGAVSAAPMTRVGSGASTITPTFSADDVARHAELRADFFPNGGNSTAPPPVTVNVSGIADLRGVVVETVHGMQRGY